MRDMLDRQTPFAQIFHATAAEGISATDADAIDYIRAVHTADGQALEKDVQIAIDDFVIGLKDDGLWTAMEACAIWGAARSLNGALVALKGPSVTNNNFVEGDYTRKTGLKGDGATTFVDTNYAHSQTGGQNDKHAAAWVTEALSSTTSLGIFGNGTSAGSTFLRTSPSNSTSLQMTIASSANTTVTSVGQSTGFLGLSRSASASFVRRIGGSDTTVSVSSFTQTSGDMMVHRVGTLSTGNSRIFFYSFGKALTLSSLESRVSTLRNDLVAAIP